MIHRSLRQFLQWAGALPLTPALLRARLAFGQESPAAVRSYAEDFPVMLVAYIESKTNELAAKWDQVRSEIHTAADLQNRNRFVREKIREMLGGFPERNPLNSVVTRVQQRTGYRVE